MDAIKDIARDISDLPEDQFESLQNNVYTADLEFTTLSSNISGNIDGTSELFHRDAGTQCTDVDSSLPVLQNGISYEASSRRYKYLNSPPLFDPVAYTTEAIMSDDEERPGAHDYYYQPDSEDIRRTKNETTRSNNDAMYDAVELAVDSDASDLSENGKHKF